MKNVQVLLASTACYI